MTVVTLGLPPERSPSTLFHMEPRRAEQAEKEVTALCLPTVWILCATSAACILGIQRESPGIPWAQVSRMRLVTGRDRKFAAESALPKKTPCISLCSYSQKYLQTFQFSLVWLSRGQIWYLHIICVTWFFHLHWIDSWSTSDVSIGSKEYMERVTRLDEAIKYTSYPSDWNTTALCELLAFFHTGMFTKHHKILLFRSRLP